MRIGTVSNTWAEYDNLDVQICAQLIRRAKEQNLVAAAPSYPASYGMPPAQYGMPPAPQPAPMYGMPPQQPAGAPGAGPDLSSLISNLDSNGLQKLLAGIQQQQPPAPHQQAPPPVLTPSSTSMTPDLARLFSGTGSAAQGLPPQSAAQHMPSGYQPQLQQAWQHPGPAGGANPYAPMQGNPALAGFMPQQQHQPPPQPQSQNMPGSVPPAGDMQEIMAQLAKYRR